MNEKKTDFIDFNLPDDAYLQFDASSLKNYIIGRLNENPWFTDQNFEGSNLNNLIDIVAYSMHVLLFYLNNTAAESQFSEAQIYDNINRLVKLIGYKPSGHKTATLPFEAESDLSSGVYTVPRYSFFNINGVAYSFIRDVSFVKETNDEEELTDFSNRNVLYQGRFEKNPDYIAVGDRNEILELPANNRNIDDSAIDVYVRRDDQWFQWNRIEDLFFARFNDNAYSVRLNDRGNYEIKFGDDNRGASLQEGDLVSVFYLKGLGGEGEVSDGFLSGSLTLFSTPRLNEILEDVSNVDYITDSQNSRIEFSNTLPSTKSSDKESVEEIRRNVPFVYQSQNRLISRSDFESFIRNNYSGFISSVKVLGNRDFLKGHMEYLSKIGITTPLNSDPRLLSNQFMFSSPANFNNVYVYAVPRVEQRFSTTDKITYLNPAQKQTIIDSMENRKEISLDVIMQDPVFMAVDLGLGGSDDENREENLKNSKLVVVRSNRSVDKKEIKDSIFNIIRNYFLPSNFELGQIIDIQTIFNSILNVKGVGSVTTENGDIVSNGLSFYIWDAVYNTNITVTSQNFKLRDFQYAFFHDIENLKSKMDIRDE